MKSVWEYFSQVPQRYVGLVVKTYYWFHHFFSLFPLLAFLISLLLWFLWECKVAFNAIVILKLWNLADSTSDNERKDLLMLIK